MLNTRVNTFVIMFVISLIAIPGSVTGAREIPNVPWMIRAQTDKPPFSAYRGVAVGMTMDEARNKLGAPKDKSDTQESYEFSDNESAQIYYGPAKNVTAITVTFMGKLDAAPTHKAVFGEEAAVKPDGGIFKMVRYPKAGFWVSYTKIGGDEPLIIIAMQKI